MSFILKAVAALFAAPSRMRTVRIDSAQDFDRHVRNSDEPIIVDFTAAWCAQCKQIEPLLEGALARKELDVPVARVDVDRMCDVADQCHVTGVPALVIFKNGRMVADRMYGLPDKEELQDWLGDNIRWRQWHRRAFDDKKWYEFLPMYD